MKHRQRFSCIKLFDSKLKRILSRLETKSLTDVLYYKNYDVKKIAVHDISLHTIFILNKNTTLRSRPCVF